MEREQLRLSLLRFLESNPTRWGLSSELLTQMARSEGRQGLKLQDVERELEYLKDKGLCEEIPKVLSPEVRTWRISAQGRDYLASNE